MASTYENDLRLQEIGTGEQSGTWGTTTNTNLELIGEALSYSATGEAIANASTHTITVADGVADEARCFYLKCTGGGQACTVTLAPNSLSKVWVIENTTSYTLTISQGSGANVAILAGQVKMIATDGAGSGAAIYDLMQDLAVPDLFVDDDLTLQSDAAVLGFGADKDTTLTHVADTGLLLNSTRQLQFGDSGTYIHQSADGVLDLVSDTEIEINATTIDINGAVDVSGTYTGGGLMTTGGNIVIPDAGNIGSASDTNAIAIGADGDVTLTQDLELQHDAATLSFGADNDVILTHVADTGLLLNSTMQLQFNDASQYINAPSATVLDINATDEVELNATLVDINANLEVSGTAAITGIATFTDDIIIGDGKTIGSASDVDAMTIASNGQVTFTQTLVGTALDISGDIDVDGTANLDIVDIDGAVNIAAATTIATNNKIQFRDTGLYLNSSTDGQLDIVADTEIQLAATTVDLNGNLDVSGTVVAAGNITTSGTVEPAGDTAAGDNAAIGYTASEGLILTGQGSTSDVVIKNDADGTVFSIATGTTTGAFAGNVTIAGDLTVTGTTTQVDTVTMEAANAVVFEGATADAHETTLTVVDPTADRTINLPNVSGTLPVLAAVSTTQVTSTPEELNILDGATVVVGEINALDLGSTAVGTAIASKAVILDSNKDYTGLRNFTVTGELDAATGDFSGNVDIDGDLLVGDDLTLDSDAAILGFGADTDVTLTHVADTGLLLNSAMVVQFRDSAINIGSPADGDLDINADDEIELNSTLIDINGNVEISGTTAQVGVSTSTAKDVFNAGMSVKNGATSAGFVEFFEDSDNGSNKVTLIGPASTADVTLTLPNAAGTLSTTDDATALAIALG